MPWDRRLPQRVDLEHYCLVLKLSSIKAPLFSNFSAIWAGAGGAEGENVFHVIIRMKKGFTLLTIFLLYTVNIFFTFYLHSQYRQEDQNISPNYTRMAAYYSMFSKKSIRNLTTIEPSMFSCLQLRTGTVSRPYWTIPTRCTSSLNPACIQSSCQRHR